MSEQPKPFQEHEKDWFLTTHWTVIRDAGAVATEASRLALENLCQAYWQPLYLFIRRKGFNEADAQDLTQEFFARMVRGNDFAGLDPRRGRFRAFLLASMNHFLNNEWRKAQTQKRGGGKTHLSLDTTLAEQHYGAHLASASAFAPEKVFDRRWAETVLERAAQALEEEAIADGKETLFRELNVFLSVPPTPGDYSALSKCLNLSEAALAKNVERLRRRYRELARREIAQTVGSASELDDEMRYLLEVLA